MLFEKERQIVSLLMFYLKRIEDMPAYRNIIELNQIIDQIAHDICQPIELIFEMLLSRSPGKKICILR